jgi:hypothetical protein
MYPSPGVMSPLAQVVQGELQSALHSLATAQATAQQADAGEAHP